MTPGPRRSGLDGRWAGRTFVLASTFALSAGMAVRSWDAVAPERPLPDLVVDANSAPLAVLMTLPGMGPALSARVVEARPYSSIDDLDRRVRGIGPATVARIRPFLRFEPSTQPLP